MIRRREFFMIYRSRRAQQIVRGNRGFDIRVATKGTRDIRHGDVICVKTSYDGPVLAKVFVCDVDHFNLNDCKRELMKHYLFSRQGLERKKEWIEIYYGNDRGGKNYLVDDFRQMWDEEHSIPSMKSAENPEVIAIWF